jgi:hypothetical protein
MRETVAVLGVVASMGFVGWQIRQSNVQARAAAYQEIGLATAQTHLMFDEWGAQLEVDQFDPSASALSEWTPLDWNRTFHTWVGVLRIWETLQLQVEQGVLPEESLETLGWHNTAPILWSSAAFVCLWPMIRRNTSQSLISIIERAEPQPTPECSFEVSGVPGLQE